MSISAPGGAASVRTGIEPVLVRQVDVLRWERVGPAGSSPCDAPPDGEAALRTYVDELLAEEPDAPYAVIVSERVAGALRRPGYVTTVDARPVFAVSPFSLDGGRLPEAYPIGISERSSLHYRFAGTPGLRFVGERRVSYDVLRSRGPVFDPSDPTLADALEDRPVLIVVDRRVDVCYGDSLSAYASRFLHCLGTFKLDAIESAKSMRNVEAICAAAYDAGLPRNGVLLGVGGGVTLDQTGLAAALYRRGVRYARVPTTLVAMVDVGVGIKQGVNAHGGKNILGAFYPAYTCINDVTFLKSLSRSAIAGGIAEIVKVALVCDPMLFALLELDGRRLLESRFQRPASTANDVIMRAEIAMMDQLRDNLYEEHHARFVDLGHTFSPALERYSEYTLPHGEAVAVDLVLSTAIAVRLRLCASGLFERLVALLRSVALPTSHPALDRELAIGALAAARAHRGGDLNLVVPRHIGDLTFLNDVDPAVLTGALGDVARMGG